MAATTHCNGIYYENAAPDILNPNTKSQTKELCFSQYAVMHSGVTRSAYWSAEHLFGSKLKTKVERTNDFHAEAKLGFMERAELSDYRGKGYDEGHLSPARDFNSIMAEHESFSLANIVPQNHDNNTKLWSSIESATRYLAMRQGELYVITGPLYIGKALKKSGNVVVPTHLYKAIFDPRSQQGAAYLVSNAPGNEYRVVSIAEIEQLSGFRLFPRMSAAAKQTALALPVPRPHKDNYHR